MAASTHAHTMAWMENDVFPWLGNRALTDIDAPEILGRGTRHTAHKVGSKIGMVFRYGIRQGLCKSDPARDLIGAIPAADTTHYAAITDLAKVGELRTAEWARSRERPMSGAADHHEGYAQAKDALDRFSVTLLGGGRHA